MPRNGRPIGAMSVVMAGIRRSRWETIAGIFAGLVAAGALVGALSLLSSMERLLNQGLERLGGDIILALPGHRESVRQWMQRGSTEQPVPADIDVQEWRRLLKEGKVLGILTTQGIDLTEGGPGKSGYPKASILVVKLEFWASPMMARVEVEAAIPGVEVVIGEQSTRHVLTDLQPLVRNLTSAAGVALLAAVLITGLLASIRVGERRAELGMLRAIGASRRFMVGITMGESLALSLTGGTLGVILTLAGMWLLPRTSGMLRVLPPLQLAALAAVAVGGTALASMVAALGPALQTARLDPLDSVRRK